MAANYRLYKVGVPREIAQALADIPGGRCDKELLEDQLLEQIPSRHAVWVALGRLRDAGFVECEYRLTPKGRRALATE